MKITQKLLTVTTLLAFFVISCTSSETTTSTSTSSTTIITSDTEETNDHAADFETIKNAILSADLAELKAHSNTEKMDAEMLIELFTDEDFSAQLTAASFDNLTEIEMDGKTYLQFGASIEGSDDEGNIYESGIYLYFDFTGEHLVLDYYLAAG